MVPGYNTSLRRSRTSRILSHIIHAEDDVIQPDEIWKGNRVPVYQEVSEYISEHHRPQQNTRNINKDLESYYSNRVKFKSSY